MPPRFEICIGQCSFCRDGRGLRLVGVVGVTARICSGYVTGRLAPNLPRERAAREAFAGGGSRDATAQGADNRNLRIAIAELEESIRTKDDVRSRLKLGDLYLKVGRRADACDQYELVAASYARDGFMLKTVAVLKQVLKMDPGRRAAHARLAEHYTALGLLEEATESRRIASVVEDVTRPAVECSFCASSIRPSICEACLHEARATLQPN